mmetsp:Transcript_56075/g.158043  ORF Transcript_56075/g.158043 Transcript_56075/m.158043 type:complete len:222 (-) Transcript_56075:1044-1709(-)
MTCAFGPPATFSQRWWASPTKPSMRESSDCGPPPASPLASTKETRCPSFWYRNHAPSSLRLRWRPGSGRAAAPSIAGGASHRATTSCRASTMLPPASALRTCAPRSEAPPQQLCMSRKPYDVASRPRPARRRPSNSSQVRASRDSAHVAQHIAWTAWWSISSGAARILRKRPGRSRSSRSGRRAKAQTVFPRSMRSNSDIFRSDSEDIACSSGKWQTFSAA